MLLMTGLSAIPFDLFNQPPTPDVKRAAANRAALARYSLDLLNETSHS